MDKRVIEIKHAIISPNDFREWFKFFGTRQHHFKMPYDEWRDISRLAKYCTNPIHLYDWSDGDDSMFQRPTIRLDINRHIFNFSYFAYKKKNTDSVSVQTTFGGILLQNVLDEYQLFDKTFKDKHTTTGLDMITKVYLPPNRRGIPINYVERSTNLMVNTDVLTAAASSWNYSNVGSSGLTYTTGTTPMWEDTPDRKYRTITGPDLAATIDNALASSKTFLAEEENKRKDNNEMMNLNVEFGPVNGSEFRMSMYGLAVRNKDNRYVSYDKARKQIIDVETIHIKGTNLFYRIPVAIKDIAIGDVVIHNSHPYFVTGFAEDSSYISAINIYEGTVDNIMPTTNMFNFNYVTKIVSVTDMCGNSNPPSADNPFGNMLPWLMLGNTDGNGSDLMAMMMMSQMMNGGAGDMNPWMMAAVLGSKDSSNMMPLMMAMSMARPVQTCNCGQT